ncbi:MAG: tetratricopeptide repeat protein [Verrucomicrobiales bacterium]|nr:tetratricopeptide repeat protein [Verrucomicrobiales bacterium]
MNLPSSDRVLGMLEMESEVQLVTDAMRSVFREFTEDAVAAVAQVPRRIDGRWDRREAEAVLRCIDATLVRHGFLYPGTGAVDLLAEALAPFQMTTHERPSYEAQAHNRRRRAMIAERFPGPFYPIDCDLAGLLYLAVAERSGLPLSLVLIPSRRGNPGHAFVRWRNGARYLNWETNEGRVLTDADYLQEYGIQRAEVRAKSALADLGSEQLLACAHHRLAIVHERRGDVESALRHLARARQLFPQNLDVRRQLAWLAATTATHPACPPSAAVENAAYVVRLLDEPDARDTLAAALAAAGRFTEAIQQEKAAIRYSSNSGGERIGYRARLHLYEQGRRYYLPGAGPTP